MKKQLAILAIISCQLFTANVFGQDDGLSSTLSIENTNNTTASFLEDPIEVGIGELVPLFGYRALHNTKFNNEHFDIDAFEIGVGVLYGDSYSWSGSGPLGFMFGGGSNWQYIAPYASVEARTLFRDSDTMIVTLRDYVSPLMLNAGAQFGFGDTDVFPVGIGGDVAFSYDFNNLYAKLSFGVDLSGLGIYYGGYFNLTDNGNNANYLSGGFVEIHYIFW